MKRLLATLLGTLFSLALVGNSWATFASCHPDDEECMDGYLAAQWVDEALGMGPELLVFNSLSYQHNIIDDGFDVGIDTIMDATLEVDFKGLGFVKVDLAGMKDDENAFVPFINVPVSISLGWYNENMLESSGVLDVTITGLAYICNIDSRLTVNGCEPVPEPATMLLFGTGLAGLAGISRRRKE